MKFLILNTDYASFLKTLYDENPGLEHQPYDRQLQTRIESLFGVADFYSRNLRKLGHEAWDIHANNFFLQTAWLKDVAGAKELYNSANRQNKTSYYVKRILQKWFPQGNQNSWFYEILAAQIRYYKPDVLLNQDVTGVSVKFLKDVKPHIRVLVAQDAAPKPPPQEEFSCYDFAISSFPPTVEFFKKKGLASYLCRMAFEPSVLQQIQPAGKLYDVSFAGNFFQGLYSGRTELIEFLCRKFETMSVWAPEINQLPEESPIRSHYRGQAWGKRLYEILAGSKITVNHHADVPPFANNMRLYEATGTGTMLITDWKENLTDMFEPQKEIVCFRNNEECGELISYYLDHADERNSIAAAGQRKTLKDHTYFQRMEEFVNIVRNYL